MSLDDHLIHTCTIENPAGGGDNAYNNAVPAYDRPLELVRCRLIETRERLWRDERQESVIQSFYRLMVRADVVLMERARITLVTVDGESSSDVYLVTEVLVRRGRNNHHKSAVLERIS